MKPMYKAKKKREVDPNAPPRPTLLGHEKVIKDTSQQLKSQQEIIDDLRKTMYDMQRMLEKLNSEMQYYKVEFNHLQHYISSKLKGR